MMKAGLTIITVYGKKDIRNANQIMSLYFLKVLPKKVKIQNNASDLYVA